MISKDSRISSALEGFFIRMVERKPRTLVAEEELNPPPSLKILRTNYK